MNWITALIVSSLVSSVLCGSCNVTLEGETNYDQNEPMKLTCRWVKIDDPINKLEIREEHGLIQYDTLAYNGSFFRVCDPVIKSIDKDNHKDYTYEIRANATKLFDGKTFTCQCFNSTSSKTLSVSDTPYGDCSRIWTNVSVVYENGTKFTKNRRYAPTYIVPCGVLENQILIEWDTTIKNWFINFEKPPACTRRLTLWGWSQIGQTDVACQLNVTADVSGDVHTFNISNTNFPKCTDGSATKEWEYAVKLEAKNGTWLEQARIVASFGPPIEANVGRAIAVILCLVIILVSAVYLVFWMKRKVLVNKKSCVPISAVPVVLGCIMVAAIVLLVVVIVLWVNDPNWVWSATGFIVTLVIIIVLLVALIGFLIWITMEFKPFSGSNKRLKNEGAGTGDSEKAPGYNEGLDNDTHKPKATEKLPAIAMNGMNGNRGAGDHQNRAATGNGNPPPPREAGVKPPRDLPPLKNVQHQNGDGPAFVNHGYVRNGSAGSITTSGDITPEVKT